MATMSLYRLGILNLIYKLKEVMKNFGFSESQYNIVDGYPNITDLNTPVKWPTISVEGDFLYGRNVEIGSSQWPSFQFSIDVFAATDSQRDDVSYYIWNELNETYNTLYDFRSGVFPTVVGVYSGISNIGDWYIDDMVITNLDVIEDSNIEGEKHHSMITGVIYLPNI